MRSSTSDEVLSDRLPDEGRNILVYMLLDPQARRLFGPGWPEEARRVVAQFQTTHDLWASDPAFIDLSTRLRRDCPEFAAWWEQHHVLSSGNGQKTLHHPEKGVAASGVGALLAGVVGSRLRRSYGADRLFTAAVVLTSVVFVGLGVISNPFLAAVMLGVNAFLGVTASVIMASLRQAIVPGHLLGRVNSVMAFVGAGIGLTAGSVAGGAIASTLGIRAPFLACAAVIAVSAFMLPQIARTLRKVALG